VFHTMLGISCYRNMSTCFKLSSG